VKGPIPSWADIQSMIDYDPYVIRVIGYLDGLYDEESEGICSVVSFLNSL
jgi:hypothetical protein